MKPFERQLSCALHTPEAMPHRLEATLPLVRAELRRRPRRISFTRFLCIQFKYVIWNVWTVQVFWLLAACCLWDSELAQRPQAMAKALFGLSVLLFLSALPFLYRSVRHRMQEVEAATHFSSGRLLLARLAAIGLGDALVLVLLLTAAAAKTSLRATSAALYLGVPFLLASAGCLYLLGHTSPGRFLAGSSGLCAGLLLCLTLPGHWGLFQQSFSAGWVAVCALLLGFCAWQICEILRSSAYTELQLA